MRLWDESSAPQEKAEIMSLAGGTVSDLDTYIETLQTCSSLHSPLCPGHNHGFSAV